MRFHERRQVALAVLERALDLVLSSRFWAVLIVAALVTWLVVAEPIRVDRAGRLVAPGLPSSISEFLGLDDATLESPEPPP
jgi:hypothetical protein